MRDPDDVIAEVMNRLERRHDRFERLSEQITEIRDSVRKMSEKTTEKTPETTAEKLESISAAVRRLAIFLGISVGALFADRFRASFAKEWGLDKDGWIVGAVFAVGFLAALNWVVNGSWRRWWHDEKKKGGV